MSLDEKNNIDQISPVSSISNDAPNTTNTTTTTTTDITALDNLQVLPKILQEGILFVASGPALLLQAAQPGLKNRLNQTNPTITTASTSTTPSLADELTTTLHATLSYIACLVFGTGEEKEALLGRLRLSQPPFPIPASSAATSDPNTQLWLLATLYATATDFYQRIYGRVDYRTAERGYAEFTLLLKHLDSAVPFPAATLWPASRTDFWRYWDDQVEHLSVSGDAHKFAHDLAHNTALPRWVGFMKPFMRVVTVEMLPVRIREAYGLKSTAGTRGLYRATMGFSVAVYPALPKSVRAYPVKYYLDEVKRVLGS
ncbi:hypothetical protein BJY01DRAFT_261007 [Aspergillus pseudoustus]|uniref:ER-bound oxygenase mpaB/mpaB'/Rubber oxygenase catalytic domain-containing protein n=1 Tax=Aspergillus pseudoustus TaxID=1810923 RepID=A0ABR4IQW2_9EURO